MTVTVAVSPSFDRSVEALSLTDRGRVFDFLKRFLRDPGLDVLHLEHVKSASDGIMSARVAGGMRCILHQAPPNYLLLFVGEHEDAYRWARLHRIGSHERTGELQLVALPEVASTPIATSVAAPTAPPLFERHADDYLLSLGVPRDWLPFLRQIRNDDALLEIGDRLPTEVVERLLDLAAGRVVPPPAPAPAGRASSSNLGERVHVVRDADDLQRLLAAPFADWVRYLHPSQKKIVETRATGPMKVSGSAGTGKTVVAMHRAAHLAREGRRVLLTSFVKALVRNIESNLRLLCNEATLARITVQTIHKTALDLCAAAGQRVQPPTDEQLRERVKKAAVASRFGAAFLIGEFENVVLRSALRTWDEYRDAPRAGRGRALSVRDRKDVWSVLGIVVDDLLSAGALPWSFVCRRAREAIESGAVKSPYDAVIVDELQDLGPAELRLVAALAGEGRQILVAGDAGQRIYAPRGLSLRALGIDVRGRSFVLKINYRTTEQIRRAADRILPGEVDDLDEGRESRVGTRSLLHGPDPEFHGFETDAKQIAFVVDRIAKLHGAGVDMAAIGVFAPTNRQLDDWKRAFSSAGVSVTILGDEDAAARDGVRLGTLHRAKGLEFRVVFVTGCSADLVPAPFVNQIEDAADREDARERQRQLVYVAMTRARDELIVTWVGEPSPFVATLAQ